MESILLVQDPQGGGIRLLDLIAEAAHGAISCQAMFAFASVDGVDRLFQHPEVIDLVKRGTIHLIVGISAITNRATLELLGRLAATHPGLSVQAFWDRDDERLFHPKLCSFDYENGRRTTIVGSGNLTPGGLAENFEALTLSRASEGEEISIHTLHAFLEAHVNDLYPVDDPDVLDRAARNIVRGRRRGAPRVEEADVVVDPRIEEDLGVDIVEREELLLVAEAPKSRGGWRQLQINQAVLTVFFRIPAVRGEELTLRQRFSDGRLGPAEHRHLVFAENSNKNLKFDVGAGGPYPSGDNRPIITFRDRGGREFEYCTLLPGDNGYAELSAHLAAAEDSIGRGVQRVMRTREQLLQIWPDCPIPLG
jgi:hypothetical protein